MLDDIYNKRILELAADIPRLGRLPMADATARAASKLCGSSIIVDLAVTDDVITDFAHDVKACALGQASASLLARLVVGATIDEMRGLHKIMHAMLKENGPPPEGKWQEFAVFTPVRQFRERQASTLLTFDAVVSALDGLEPNQAGAASVP